MQEWVLITLYAALVQVLKHIYERSTKENERLKEFKQKVKESDEEEAIKMLSEMNMILLRRAVFFIIIFLPIYYLFSGVGNIQTPIGAIPWIVWYMLSFIIIGGVFNGILRAKAYAQG